jgi:hypothetical protein
VILETRYRFHRYLSTLRQGAADDKEVNKDKAFHKAFATCQTLCQVYADVI